MERREALKSMSLAFGYSLTPALLSGLLTSCTREASVDWKPIFFNQKEAFAIEQIAEVILPKSEVPGANDVLSQVFIDRFVAKVFEKKDQEKIKAGVTAWVQGFESKKALGSAEKKDVENNISVYFNVDPKEQDAINQLMRKEYPAESSEKYLVYSFLFTIKRLAMMGYYNSEEVGEQVLSYLPVPGKYEGCIPLEQVGNAWSL